jgi:hypothetical protein
MRQRLTSAIISAWLGVAAAAGSVTAAPFTLLEYSDTEFAADLAWFSTFDIYMDPDNLPPRPEDAALYVRLPFYVEEVGRVYEYKELRSSPSRSSFYVDGADVSWGGPISWWVDAQLALTINESRNIHEESFSGFFRAEWGSDYFYWNSRSGGRRYTSTLEYAHEKCPLTSLGRVCGIGVRGQMNGTWSIVDSAPPPPVVPLPASSMLLVSGVLLAASAKVLRRRRG